MLLLYNPYGTNFDSFHFIIQSRSFFSPVQPNPTRESFREKNNLVFMFPDFFLFFLLD